MTVKGDKKLLGAYILEILKKETDSDYAKTIEDIIEEIADKYDISVDKRTIQRYIKMIKDCGYNIVSEEYDKSNYHQKAYYIKDEINETFTDAEVRYIIDAIIFSKHINKKMAKHIINQFRELYSNPLVESLKYINEIKPDDEKKLLNSQDMFANIETIHDAIRRKQKIKIWFMNYEFEGNDFKLKKYIKKNKIEQESYELYPFYMIPANDVYFLIAYNENAKKGSEIYALRIDHIERIETIGSFTPTIKKNYKEFDINKFVSEHPIMSYGNVIDCEFIYPAVRIVDVYDFFGRDVSISGVSKNKDYVKVKTRITRWALKKWIGGHIEFIKNVKVKDKLFAKEMNDIIKSFFGGVLSMSKLKINHCSNLDSEYNYLSDAMDSSGKYRYNPDDYKYCDDSKINCSIKATIRGQCYKDPDSYSKKLYEDFEKITELKINKQSKYIYLSDDSFINYTTDYIGPSRYWMRAADLNEKETGEFLLIARTIGGHMIWPCKRKYVKVNGYEDKMTINTARGGEHGVYDRIDFTLKEVKNYFLNIGFTYSGRLYKAIENEKYFFEQYGAGISGFISFIDAFKLNDFVEKETYEPLSLVASDFENGMCKAISTDEKADDILKKDNAMKYIKNNNYAIMRRSEKLCQSK